eukprot:14281124-Alexandrium_andersonii.AAC.1
MPELAKAAAQAAPVLLGAAGLAAPQPNEPEEELVLEGRGAVCKFYLILGECGQLYCHKQHLKGSQGIRARSALLQKECKHGAHCLVWNCIYKHPAGHVPKGP